MLRVLDLFSGIGGFSLGLERTGGFRTVAFCEIDKYCQMVLHKHWPGTWVFGDVRDVTAARVSEVLADSECDGRDSGPESRGALPATSEVEGKESEPRRIADAAANGCSIDVICGGFPCQDISFAGKGAGITGERSGLWSEYARIIGEVRPRYVIVENVAALLGRGLGRVLGDLAALGYDAEWHCIPASAVGAPHRRDRVWIVAYPNRDGEHDGAIDAEVGGTSESVADYDEPRLQGRLGRLLRECAGQWTAGAGDSRYGIADWWQSEPDVGRVAHGVPARVDRLRSLGNAVVPQVVEVIGRAILEAELT